jgi:hypothetical protein
MSGPQSDKPEDRSPNERRAKSDQPKTAPPGTAAGGFPEPPGPEATDRDLPPHHSLSHPVGEPDPTEWPDPYDQREDPRDPPDPDGLPFGEEPHAPTGSQSTSEPHPDQDIEAGETNPPHRDRLED